MTYVGLGLSYWLPETHFDVAAVMKRRVRQTTAGRFLSDAVEVSVSTRVLADTASRQALHVDTELWDKLSLTTILDDQGFLTSINSQPTHGGTPVISFVGKAVTLPSVSASTIVESHEAESLEEQWALRNANLARHHRALEVQIGTLLEHITRTQPPSAIVEIGKALEVLESQLASISEMRRSWVAAQAHEVDSGTLDLTPTELLAVPGSELPWQLHDPEIPVSMSELADAYGALLAICDPDRPAEQTAHSKSLGDRLVLRRSRPVLVGTYLRSGSGSWDLQADKVLSIDVVDRWSHTDYLSLQGTWLRSQQYALASHTETPRRRSGHSIEAEHTTAISSPVVAGLDDADNALKQIPRQSTGTAGRRETATSRPDHSETTSEYEALAAARHAGH